MAEQGEWIYPAQNPVRLPSRRHVHRHLFFDPKPLSFNPRKFAIEILDKNFNLKSRVEPYVTSFRWEWNRIGGCGRATFRTAGDYNRLNIESDDDVRLWLPDASGTSATLAWRGYVEGFSSSVQGGDEGINIECAGYFERLSRLIIHSSGGVKTYTGMEVSSIVRSILQTFVTPVTGITIGNIHPSDYSPDTISFKTTVRQALDTLFDLLGNVEYGVDQNLSFFWFNQNDNVTHKFYLGDKITTLDDRRTFRDLVNYIYFEGGTVSGSAFTTTGSSDDSISRYGRYERILQNGSITTLGVASQYISGILSQKAKPQLPLSVHLMNTNKRLEESLPIGAIGIIDSIIAQTAALYGTTANGGSNKLYGKTQNSGSGQLWGGTRKDQVDRIQYTFSPEDGRVDAVIQFGDTADLARAAATLKRMELVQETVRQRSL